MVSAFAVPIRAQYHEDQDASPNVVATDFSIEQERKEPIAVRHYTIDAELIPNSHQLKGKAQIQFETLQDVNSVTFELNENLFPTRVLDNTGKPLSTRRTPNNLQVEVALGQTIQKGQNSTISFEYEGVLADAEHSPVEGVQLAYVGPEGSYLLYPGRWFPESGYSIQRYTADIHLTLPAGMNVVSGGRAQAPSRSGDKSVFSFTIDKPEFPGSIAVTTAQPQTVAAEGLTMKVYFSAAHQAMAQPYGQAAAKIVNFYSSKFGPPPVANLSLVEIDDHSLGGYSGPETIFLAARGIGTQVNVPLLAQEIAQQWWRGLVSPASTSDLWLDHGLATYSAALYIESANGEAALTDRIRQMSIDALTNDNIPIRAAGHLPDFSPQFHSIIYDKAGVVMHMLRWVIGDQAFFASLHQLADKYAFRSASTDDYRALAEQASGQKLGPFFLQWMESTGASDFKADYIVYRVGKGYKVVGKIHQDMDTFSMPVEVTVETTGAPVTERVQVTGRDSEFSLNTNDLPKKVSIDPNDRVLKFNDSIRVKVEVARGEQQVEQRDYSGALEAYQKALDINRTSSLAHYRVGEAFFQLRNYQSAANAFREALNGDLVPKWTEVWSHVYLGKIFDVTGQRDRAMNEYQQAVRTKDDTQGALELANQYLKAPYERPSREIESAESTAAPAAAPPAASGGSSSSTPAGNSGSDSSGRPTLRRRSQ